MAIWEVGERAAAWTPIVGEVVGPGRSALHPWGDEPEALWCPHITFHGEHGRVEVVMGDTHDGALVPWADNVAVLHPGTALPSWLG